MKGSFLRVEVSNMNLYLDKEKRICSKCGGNLKNYDVDYNFVGNQDEYYECEKCGHELRAKVRFGKVVKICEVDSEDSEDE